MVPAPICKTFCLQHLQQFRGDFRRVVRTVVIKCHVHFLRPAGDGGEPAQVSGAGPLATLCTARGTRPTLLAITVVRTLRAAQPLDEPLQFIIGKLDGMTTPD
mgnify:CR=1 FL=1